MTMDRDKSGADDPVNREQVDRYRQASAELDERPSASARASILAAAAREVGARPVDAAAPRRVRPRWPLAAAAAVMLSTLAVMLAIRTNEEMPQFSSPSEPARSTLDNATPPAEPAPAAAPPPSMAEQPTNKRAAADQQSPESRPTRTQERSATRAKTESDSVAQAPRETSRPALTEGRVASAASELERARQNNVPAASPASPPPEPTVQAKLRKEQAEAGAVAQTPMDQASADARRDAARSAAPAPLSAAQSGSKQEDESAAVWLERIIKLRREGRHDEADLELKRFRERYPQVQPPPEALGSTQQPAGTR